MKKIKLKKIPFWTGLLFIVCTIALVFLFINCALKFNFNRQCTNYVNRAVYAADANTAVKCLDKAISGLEKYNLTHGEPTIFSYPDSNRYYYRALLFYKDEFERINSSGDEFELANIQSDLKFIKPPAGIWTNSKSFSVLNTVVHASILIIVIIICKLVINKNKSYYTIIVPSRPKKSKNQHK